MKLALICHFSTEKLRNKLGIRTRGIKYYIRERLGHSFKDYAPWIDNIIEDLKKNKEVELHIIAPHAGIGKKSVQFEDDGVCFHIFNSGKPAFLQIIGKLLHHEEQNYYDNRKRVRSFIDNIKPDVVILSGAENPYYSITALDIDNIPIIVLLQTVYANPDRLKSGERVSQYRWDTELKVFHHTKYFFCAGDMHYRLLKQYEPDSIVMPYSFPSKPFPILKDVPKKYDFVFFAQRVIASKGIECALQALLITKRYKSDVSLIVVGSCDKEYKKTLDKFIIESNLNENVLFHDYFPQQIDMFNYVKQARFALLPIKLDVISGTIFQAMSMGLPVITHKTSGTPILNKERECVLLSEIGDIKSLSDNMILLLSSDEVAERLRINSITYIQTVEKKNMLAGIQMINHCKAVVDHYRRGVPIPEDMLYHISE